MTSFTTTAQGHDPDGTVWFTHWTAGSTELAEIGQRAYNWQDWWHPFIREAGG